MWLSRDFIIQIVKGSTTYSNTSGYETEGTTLFGITAGSQKLDRILCTDELILGNCNSTKFEVQIYNCSEDLSGCDIMVYCSIDHNDPVMIFKGVIDSSERDKTNYFRKLIAYDKLYFVREQDVSYEWDNNMIWYDDVTEISLKTIRQRLCTCVGLTDVTTATFPNDGTMFAPHFVSLPAVTFGQLIKMICELQCTFPVITGSGDLEFIQLGTTATDLTTLYNTKDSTFEDYNTNTIGAINVYATSSELTQTVGQSSALSTYSIVGNIFVLSWDATHITNYLLPVLSQLSAYSYNPAKIVLILSDFSYKLGDKVSITRENVTYYHYIMNISLSDSLLIKEILTCPAKGKNLDNSVQTKNNALITDWKFTRIEQTIDNISLIAQSKNKTYYQNAVPTEGIRAGDLWYVIGQTAPQGYTLGKWYRYDGSVWDLTEDSTIAEHTARLDVQSERIDAKVSQTGGTTQSFGWSLTSSGFFLYSDDDCVFQIDSNTAIFAGALQAATGTFTGTLEAATGSFGYPDVIDVDYNKIYRNCLFTIGTTSVGTEIRDGEVFNVMAPVIYTEDGEEFAGMGGYGATNNNIVHIGGDGQSIAGRSTTVNYVTSFRPGFVWVSGNPQGLPAGHPGAVHMYHHGIRFFISNDPTENLATEMVVGQEAASIIIDDNGDMLVSGNWKFLDSVTMQSSLSVSGEITATNIPARVSQGDGLYVLSYRIDSGSFEGYTWYKIQ